VFILRVYMAYAQRIFDAPTKAFYKEHHWKSCLNLLLAYPCQIGAKRAYISVWFHKVSKFAQDFRLVE